MRLIKYEKNIDTNNFSFIIELLKDTVLNKK